MSTSFKKESKLNTGLEHGQPVSLTGCLEDYLTSFYQRVELYSEIPDQAETIVKAVCQRSSEIIERNNEMAKLISSSDYESIVIREKELRGPCALGASICIDGRLPIVHLFGRIVSCWEKKAGEIKIEASPLDNSPQLASGRLTEAIIDRAKKGPLLEILVAHTSLSDPKHGCGAMLARQAKGEFPADCDLVTENLKIHEQSAEAITDLYNRAAGAYSGEKLVRVAITAVYDTDTMGFVFGYGEENSLVTTDLTSSLVEQNSELSELLYKKFGLAYKRPGIMKELFTEADLHLDFETMICNIAGVLLEYDDFLIPVNNYFNSAFSDLELEQQQALRFLIARNVAFQYLTGLYKSQEHPDHIFAVHGEGYQAVSLDGIILGHSDPEVQVFGASPDTVDEVIGHVLTQCALMDKNAETEKPYILFASTATSRDRNEAILERDRGRDREFYYSLLKDKEIMDKVKKGELVVIPVLIDDRTRAVVEVLNHAV